MHRRALSRGVGEYEVVLDGMADAMDNSAVNKRPKVTPPLQIGSIA